MIEAPRQPSGWEISRRARAAAILAALFSTVPSAAATDIRPPVFSPEGRTSPDTLIKSTNNSLFNILKIMRVEAAQNNGIEIRSIKVGGQIVKRYIATAAKNIGDRKVYDSFVADVLPHRELPYRTYYFASSDSPDFKMSEKHKYRSMLDHNTVPDESYNLTIKNNIGKVVDGGAVFSDTLEVGQYTADLYTEYTQSAADTVFLAAQAAIQKKPTA